MNDHFWKDLSRKLTLVRKKKAIAICIYMEQDP